MLPLSLLILTGVQVSSLPHHLVILKMSYVALCFCTLHFPHEAPYSKGAFQHLGPLLALNSSWGRCLLSFFTLGPYQSGTFSLSEAKQIEGHL